MKLSLCGRVSLNTHRLAGTLAGSGIGLCALTADGQASAVALTAVGLDGLKSLQVHAQFTTKITLSHILALLDRIHDQRQLSLIQGLGAKRRIDVGPLQNFERIDRTDSVDVAECDIDSLVRRNINSHLTEGGIEQILKDFS